MKTITVKELRIGDIFIHNGTPYIVDKLIITNYGIIRVILKFLSIDMELCCTYELFVDTCKVIKISI